MAERTGRSLDAGNFRGFRMTAENRIAAAEGIERLERNEALVGEHHVQRDAAVALAQDHAVAAWPFRLVRPKAQHVVVEHAHDLDERHRGADMPALAALQACARPSRRKYLERSSSGGVARLEQLAPPRLPP